ncbi:MAG TPA: hypothetical protein VHE54_20140 [Puia sp.]|nr:hypothetical protein [Puia sp.]
MMRLVLLGLLCITFCTITRAQTASDTTVPQSAQRKPSPARQAARQLKSLEKQLRLSQDQVLRMQVILINRDVAMDSLRNQAAGNGRGKGSSRRAIQQQTDRQIDSLLTEDQKPLYRQWKQQQRDRAKQRRLQAATGQQ